MAGMTLTLEIWRQNGPTERGRFVQYKVSNIIGDMSFLEMLDVLNEELIKKGDVPVEFDHDCREGICGCCGMMINGQAHGPERGTTVCQLHMRNFKDGDTIVIEPFRSGAFPIIKDLVVDRSAMDRIMQAGGYVAVRTGPHADANTTLIAKPIAEEAMDAAMCIGCGACIAACPNSSASLFTGAKISQFALLPQGHPERTARVQNMVAQMDEEKFGACSNIGECTAACPKEISLTMIARMKAEFARSLFAGY